MDELTHKLYRFKKKYYHKKVSAGLLLFLIITLGLFLVFISLEYAFWFNPLIRGMLFFLFLATFLVSLYQLVIIPLLKWKNLQKGISDLEAAHEINKHFPEIQDRLINAIQLSRYSQEENDLLSAAITKKVSELSPIKFSQAIDYKVVKKYLAYFSIIFFSGLLLSFAKPDVVTEGSKRIVNYSEHYVKKAPFDFVLLNGSLETFRGEDFTVDLKLKGDYQPEELFLIDDNNRIRLTEKEGTYSYVLSRLREDKTIHFEAAGFLSQKFTIQVNDRPEMLDMSIEVIPPAYTSTSQKTIQNNGNILVLEGSRVVWNLNTQSADQLSFLLDEKPFPAKPLNDQFVVDQHIHESGSYEIQLQNQFGSNASELRYQIDVVKDQYPEIKAEIILDSTNYRFFSAIGNVTDDYGFTRLIAYLKTNENHSRVPISFEKNLTNQSFFFMQRLDSLNIQSGEKIEIYIEVADNDPINGYKTRRTPTFHIEIPAEEELEEQIEKTSESVEGSLSKSQESSSEVRNVLEELEKRLKTEQEIGWQEEKLIDELIKNKEKLNEEIDQLNKEHQQLNNSKDQFRQQSETIKEKNDQLQELLNELMDEETLELYKKLKELLEEEANSSQMQQELEKIKQNEKVVEQELERALELFKRLKLESEIEQNLQKLDSLSKQQENLSEKAPDQEAQEEVNEAFEEFREKMDEIEQMNQELKNPEPIKDFELEERQIQKELDEILKEMSEENPGNEEGGEDSKGEKDQNSGKEENNSGESSDSQEGGSENGEETGKDSSSSQKSGQSSSGKDTSKKQKKAAEQMRSLSKQLSQMQSGMQMEVMQANLDQLRDIADNLVKLSFDQESILKELKTVNQSDPRFLELSQEQLKLKDDARVIQDSLLSLATKVVQISSFVTREVASINKNMDESLDFLRDRNRGRALSSQQFSMTSINNLALLLDNTMQQMQMAMAESMGNSKGEQKQQGKGLPDLTEMQNQLGKGMQELQQSGKEGRELSEELARLAAEQEMIRRQMELLKEAQDGKPGGGSGGEDLERAIRMMEQNEIDLVNKRLTRQLISRQKQIETRMLEAEKAQRDQSEDDQREGEQAKNIERNVPPEFEEYIKLKQKEIELLKSVPLDLNPFYKKEVNDYFRRISTGQSND